MSRPPQCPGGRQAADRTVRAGGRDDGRRGGPAEQGLRDLGRQVEDSSSSKAAELGLAAGPAPAGPSAGKRPWKPRSRSSPPPWVRPTSSCGCGRSPRSTAWPLRRPRGDPPRRGDADFEVLHADWHPAPHLHLPAGQGPRRAPRPRARGRPRWSRRSSRWRPSTPPTGRPGATARSAG